MSGPIGILSIEPKILWSQNTARGSMRSNPKNGYEMVWSRKEAYGSMGSSIQDESMEPLNQAHIHSVTESLTHSLTHSLNDSGIRSLSMKLSVSPSVGCSAAQSLGFSMAHS